MNQPRSYTIEGSTDIGGISPWLGEEIWQRYARLLNGIEVIGWRWSTAAFLQTSHLLKPTRIHGPLGGGGGRIAAYDHSLIPDHTLLKLSHQHHLDVLVHAPHAANGFNHSLTSWYRDTVTLPTIWVENHRHGDAGVAAVTAVAASLHTRIMFDLAHYLDPLQPVGFAARWDRMITVIDSLSQRFSVGIHFPIGDLIHDSIDLSPTGNVTDAMLKRLKPALQSVHTIVLEYQSPLIKYLATPSQRKRVVYSRLDYIMDRLQRVGIM